MRKPDCFSPEQQQAIAVFRAELLRKDELLVERVMMDHVARTSSKIFVKGTIGRASLPHGEHWVWNQSKAQKVVETNNEFEVILKKLNPRKKSKEQKQGYPHYKLWVFVIKYRNHTQNEDSNINFIWCEKGEDWYSDWYCEKRVYEEEPAPKIVPIETVHELSFLADFMDPIEVESIFGLRR